MHPVLSLSHEWLRIGVRDGLETCQRALVDLFRALGLGSDAHGLDQSRRRGVGLIWALRMGLGLAQATWMAWKRHSLSRLCALAIIFHSTVTFALPRCCSRGPLRPFIWPKTGSTITLRRA